MSTTPDRHPSASPASGTGSGEAEVCRHQMQSFEHPRGGAPRTTCRLCGDLPSAEEELIPAQARLLAAMDAAVGPDPLTGAMGLGWTVGVICGDGRIRAISERVWPRRADVSAVIDAWDDTQPHSIVAAAALVPMEV